MQLLLGALASSLMTLVVLIVVQHIDTRMMVNGPVYRGLAENQELVADVLPPPAYALEAYLNCFELASAKDAATRDALVARGATLTTEFDARMRHWTLVETDREIRVALLDKAQAHARTLFDVRDRELVPAVRRGDTAATAAAMASIREAYTEHRAAIDEVVARAQQVTARDEQAAERALTTSRWISYIAMLLGLVVPLAVLGMLARQIAGRLARAVSELRVRGAALRTASTEVADASESLSRGVETQAQSVEETAAALEEISTMSMRNAQDASVAAERTTVAADAADGSVSRVDELVIAMDQIRASANGIATVIRTIDEIAFQTNMLSLNAAVEAARAGDAGLGFAIVADEVRMLAGRSGIAARDTTEMIDEANRRSERGVELMRVVRDTLAAVAANSRGLLALSRQIQSASQEQAKGVSATNVAINRMDTVIAQNSQLAHRVSTSSVGLAEHASELVALATRLDALVHGEHVTHEDAAAA